MFGAIEIFLLSVSVLFIVLVKCTDKNPPPIFGIYQRKSGLYWFKVLFLYFIFNLHQIKQFFKEYELNKFEKFEKPQKMPVGFEKATDVVTFTGANKNGDYLIVNFGKRHQSVDGYFFLKIKDSQLGVLALANYPDNELKKAAENDYEYSTEGIELICVEPLKKWRIIYKGKMVQVDNTKIDHEVEIEGVWTSDLPAFDKATNLDYLNTAKCIAYEKLNKTYFNNLKTGKRDVYDQCGILQLKVTIGAKNYKLVLDTSKSRSIENNTDDSLYYKAGSHQFSTENGDFFNVGQACVPLIASRLSGGFVYNAKHKEFYPVQKCSFELYKYGGIDASPDDYGFTFRAGDKDYAVIVAAKDAPYVYSGPNWETKTYLKMSTFKVNGKQGWGVAKWIYRNVDGKDVK